MASTMGLQQQAASQDTVDFAGYLQSAQCHQAEGQVQGCQKSPHREHNSSFTSTKGLLNGPGQNNCFLNSAVQYRYAFRRYNRHLKYMQPAERSCCLTFSTQVGANKHVTREVIMISNNLINRNLYESTN
ncbi:PREDICTED: uncharacterized protein LOC105451824 isoform X1 [Wasmannia auropunctata]|uniref:uncharacterized protein LOC105451824 isoform X1 n=1 Tax=Wasmannia auropunctata TaxID=64793 RepID=UPI0005F092B0|nr:PREDICTED: uncharacterized protein LOC105451824 isoform X1 [Wasmannia auropunctata]